MFKIVFLIAIVFGVSAAAKAPVILIGADSPVKPSLPTIGSEEFAGIITPLAEGHMIAVIQEEGLSENDFLCKSNRAEKQQSCYAHLQGFTPKTYYRSVENPTKVLEALDANYETITITKGGKLETPLKCKAGKVAFLRFTEESDMNREDTLEAHDYIISNLMKQMACPTIFLYTATSTADVLKRSRRALSVDETAALKGGNIFSNPKFQIFYTTLSFQKAGDKSATPITISTMNVADSNKTNIAVTLTGGADTITFDMSLLSDYYYMKQLTLKSGANTYVFRTDSMNAPTAFSYYCGDLTASTSGGDKLRWNSLQLQAPFGRKVKTVDNKFVFGESWNCVGFVTPAILAGLFVVAILLAILFTGICWIVDINTMDRFDDPKGKTITVNANE